MLSAAEIEREGLDLASNQANLLKKIEELTLYAIDQNKPLIHCNLRCFIFLSCTFRITQV